MSGQPTETDKLHAKIDEIDKDIKEYEKKIKDLQVKADDATRKWMKEKNEDTGFDKSIANRDLQRAETNLTELKEKEKDYRGMLKKAQDTAAGVKQQICHSTHLGTISQDTSKRSRSEPTRHTPVQPHKAARSGSPSGKQVGVPNMPAGSPTAWRVKMSVPGGVRMVRLRSDVIRFAQKHVGYDGSFEYEKLEADRVTEDSALVIVVYFREVNNASQFVNEIEERLRPSRLIMEDCDCTEEKVVHEPDTRVMHGKHYSETDSPNDEREEFGKGMEKPMSPSSATSTVISVGRLGRESICDQSRSATKMQDVHIIEKAKCKGDLEQLDNDKANRIILLTQLHQFYDGQGAFGRTCFSIYCNDDFSRYKDMVVGEPVLVNLHVHIFFQQVEGEIVNVLRNPQQVTDIEDKIVYSVTIHHHNPWRFAKLLNIRYARDLENSGEMELHKLQPFTAGQMIELKCLCHDLCCEHCGALKDSSRKTFTRASLVKHKSQCSKRT